MRDSHGGSAGGAGGNRAGITLFEAVAALAILGVVSISALEAVGSEMRTAERARRALEVEALATQRLDFLALMNDRELQDLPDSVSKGQFDKPLDGYKWTTTATPRTDPSGVYDVVVKVDWANGSYTLKSALYRRPAIATRGGR
jgi:type II secretory pathway pseudopilin PulG